MSMGLSCSLTLVLLMLLSISGKLSSIDNHLNSIIKKLDERNGDK